MGGHIPLKSESGQWPISLNKRKAFSLTSPSYVYRCLHKGEKRELEECYLHNHRCENLKSYKRELNWNYDVWPSEGPDGRKDPKVTFDIQNLVMLKPHILQVQMKANSTGVTFREM
jgi:hypothetical protein